jgi:hypothetical protein
MNYYYAKNEEKIGPLDLDELKKVDIKYDTLVWHEGLDDWVKANELKELKSLFKTEPVENLKNESNGKKWGIRVGKFITFFTLFWIFIIIGIVQMTMQERHTIPALWMILACILSPYLAYSKWANNNIWRRNKS